MIHDSPLEFIKVSIPGESFWIKVEHEIDGYVYGVVNNHLTHTLDDYAWCKYGADVKWHKVDQVLSEWTESICTGHLYVCEHGNIVEGEAPDNWDSGELARVDQRKQVQHELDNDERVELTKKQLEAYNKIAREVGNIRLFIHGGEINLMGPPQSKGVVKPPPGVTFNPHAPSPSNFVERWKVYQDKIDKQVERFHYLQELKKYLEKMEGPSDLINQLVEHIDELKDQESEVLGNVINSSY